MEREGGDFMSIGLIPVGDSADRRVRQIIDAETRQTDRLISAQQRTTAQVEALRRAVEVGTRDVDKGVRDLAEQVGWGLADVNEKLDVQTGLLKQIVDAMQVSDRTKAASEARRNGIEYFRLGWADEALEQFSQCLAANGTDYVASLFTALIQVQQNNREAGLDHAQKAAKYAAPYSTKWAGFALALIAHVYYDSHQYQAALDAAKQALDSDLPVAYYEQARAQAALGQTEAALGALEKAIVRDPTYYDLVTGDAAFDAIRSQVADLRAELLALAEADLQHALTDGDNLRKVGHACQALDQGELNQHKMDSDKLRGDGQTISLLHLLHGAGVVVSLNSRLREQMVRNLESHIDYLGRNLRSMFSLGVEPYDDAILILGFLGGLLLIGANWLLGSSCNCLGPLGMFLIVLSGLLVANNLRIRSRQDEEISRLTEILRQLRENAAVR